MKSKRILAFLLISVMAITSVQYCSNILNGAATGSISLIVLPAGAIACSISMDSNWNAISLCANATDKDITDILSGTDYKFVMRWNTGTQQFDVWSAGQASPPFSQLDENQSYFVYMNAADTLNVMGSNNEDMNISLVQNWNEPAYPYEFASTVEKVVTPINDTYRFVMKWNTTSQSFSIYSPNQAVKPFTVIDIGNGLFVYQDSADTLRYNRTLLA